MDIMKQVFPGIFIRNPVVPSYQLAIVSLVLVWCYAKLITTKTIILKVSRTNFQRFTKIKLNTCLCRFDVMLNCLQQRLLSWKPRGTNFQRFTEIKLNTYLCWFDVMLDCLQQKQLFWKPHQDKAQHLSVFKQREAEGKMKLNKA